jgi:exodeoxyribonuclease VII large subunit
VRGRRVEDLEVAASALPISVGALLDEVAAAIDDRFPQSRTVWVRGEIQKLIEPASGHCYIDLVDPDRRNGRDAPVLKVNCWRVTWQRLRGTLARQGITLQQGMVVTLGGVVEFSAPRAEVRLIARKLDVEALLGRLAAERADLLRRLEAEGMLHHNAGLPMSPVPLRVGLVGSPGTEGFKDFVGQLVRSSYAFRIGVVPTSVQGVAAQGAIAAAIGRFSAADEWDVVVVVRGGGAPADLAVFDSEAVARAITTCPLPVWTGIGHTGDQSVADIVAHSSFVTPTACGRELVSAVDSWWAERCQHARDLARLAERQLARQLERHDRACRALSSGVRLKLGQQRERLVGQSARLETGAQTSLRVLRSALQRRAGVLVVCAQNSASRAGQAVASQRKLVAAYDVEQQLRRGYTLTTDADGRLLRHASAVRTGDLLVTRFADGTAVSRAEAPPNTPAVPVRRAALG